jgi:hypothetical protein
MSALHRQWVEQQADAAKYQREMRELDAYVNPYRRQTRVPRQPQPIFQPTAARRFSTAERKTS